MWPTAARELTTVRYIEGATHQFDLQKPPRPGLGFTVVQSPTDAAEARQAVVSFFVKYLKP